MDDNYLTRLPHHIFLTMASNLSVNSLLKLEKTELFEAVVGYSPLIESCFDNMKYFKLFVPVKFNRDDCLNYMKVLYRTSKNLKRFNFVTISGRNVTNGVLKACGVTLVELANAFPNLTGFDDEYVRGRWMIAYILKMKGECKISEIITTNPRIITRCPELKTLVLGPRRLKKHAWKPEMLPLTDEDIDKIATKCLKLEKLDARSIDCFNIQDYYAILMLSRKSNITKLELELTKAENRTLDDVKQLLTLPKLTELSLDVFGFGNDPLWNEINPLLVTKLKINDYQDLKPFFNLRELKVIHAREEILDVLLDTNNLPYLKSFEYDYYQPLSDEAKLMDVFKARGGIIRKLCLLSIKNHREFVNGLIDHCHNLST